MKVQRISTEHGSHIVPPLDQSWSTLQKLLWQAGVLYADTGHLVYVEPAQYTSNGIPQHGFFMIQYGNSAHGPLVFHDMWTYINGLSAGIELERSNR